MPVIFKQIDPFNLKGSTKTTDTVRTMRKKGEVRKTLTKVKQVFSIDPTSRKNYCYP